MGKLEEAIRGLIKSQFGSIPKFAQQIGIPPTTIYNALDRGMANTRTETTDKIYRKLNIDWDTATLTDFKGLRIKGDAKNAFVPVPVYGRIAAGTPIEMTESDETHDIPRQVHDKYPNAFLLRVDGESMNRILPNGCYALVNPCEEVTAPGQPYAVCVNGYDATIKRVKLLNNGFELIPDSNDPTYRPTVYDYGVQGTETVTIIGRVVWYCLPYQWSF